MNAEQCYVDHILSFIYIFIIKPESFCSFYHHDVYGFP